MKRRRVEAIVRCLVWSALAAVGSALGCGSAGDDLSGTSGAPPACRYAAGLGTLETPVSGACTAARAALSCQGSNGGGQFCLSDELGQCPASNVITPGVTYSNCTDKCQPNEYAVSCGIAGPSASPSPPAGCRVGASSPGGPSYCCPCG